MKKLLLVISLVLGVCNLQAKSLFDLHEQYFKNTILSKDGKFTAEGRYELPNVFVSTNTYFNKGTYNASTHGSGYFSVDMKNPPKNWRVSASVYRYSTSVIIRTSSVNGKSNIVTLSQGSKLQINSEEYKAEISETITQINIEYTNQVLTVYFNGQAAFKEEQKDNSGLKKVEILMTGFSNGNNFGIPKLSSLQVFEQE